jgi:hypothetical protein
MQRSRDVLEPLLAHILQEERDLVANLIAHGARNADLARLGKRFQTGRYVDRVAMQIGILQDYIAEVDPDTEPQLPFGRHRGVTLGDAPLHLHRATDRFDRAYKADQHPVARVLNDAAPM